VLGEVCHAGTTFGLQDFLRQVKEGETRIVGQNLGVIVRRRRTKLRVCGSCAWQILSNGYVLAMVGHLKNVSPTFAQMPNRITNVEFTTVSPTIANTMLCAVFH